MPKANDDGHPQQANEALAARAENPGRQQAQPFFSSDDSGARVAPDCPGARALYRKPQDDSGERKASLPHDDAVPGSAPEMSRGERLWMPLMRVMRPCWRWMMLLRGHPETSWAWRDVRTLPRQEAGGRAAE